MAVTWKEIVKGAVSTGSSTGTGGQQTIAHGLGAKPNLVSVTPDVTDASASVKGLGKDNTNIYVTVTSGKAFDWVAMVI